MIKWIVSPSVMAKRIGYCNDTSEIIVDFGSSGVYSYQAGHDVYGAWLAAPSFSYHFRAVIKSLPYAKLDPSDPRLDVTEVSDES